MKKRIIIVITFALIFAAIRFFHRGDSIIEELIGGLIVGTVFAIFVKFKKTDTKKK